MLVIHVYIIFTCVCVLYLPVHLFTVTLIFYVNHLLLLLLLFFHLFIYLFIYLIVALFFLLLFVLSISMIIFIVISTVTSLSIFRPTNLSGERVRPRLSATETRRYVLVIQVYTIFTFLSYCLPTPF